MTDDPRLVAGAQAYGRGEVAQALRIFEEVAATSTGDLRLSALINAASMSDDLGDHTKAAAAYREALAELPADDLRKRPAALINLSQAQQHLGDLDAAQASLEEAHALLAGTDNETLVPVLLSLTAVAMHRHRWAAAAERATESLDAAVRLAPNLAGHPLMNLAAVHFETGRYDLADDFAAQALAAFEHAGDTNAVADTQQNIAMMYAQSDRIDDAEPLVQASQEYFERSGFAYRAGIGLGLLGALAQARGDDERARAQFERSLAYFDSSGAVLDAAETRSRLAVLAFAAGDPAAGEALFAVAFASYAERGLGLHCAQLDFKHAALLDPADPRAVELAVPAALAIDAVRFTFPNGRQRDRWSRGIAEPAMRLAFRLATAAQDATLIGDLIETQCAGATFQAQADAIAEVPIDVLEPPVDEPGPLRLGIALAAVASGPGIAIAPPPRLSVGGRIVLAHFIDSAESRYGRAVRDETVVPVW